MTNPTEDENRRRVMQVVDEAGGEIFAEDLCAEFRRRGWSFDDFSPSRMGMEPNTIIRRKR